MTKPGLGGCPEIYDEAFLAAAAADVIQWANEPESLTMMGWRGHRGYGYDQVTGWCNKSKKFALAYESAKAIVGDRREAGAVAGKLSSAMVNKTRWQYDKEARNREDEVRLTTPHQILLTPADRAEAAAAKAEGGE